MTKEELKRKKAEIVDQLLQISAHVKQLNDEKSLLINELMDLESKETMRILN